MIAISASRKTRSKRASSGVDMLGPLTSTFPPDSSISVCSPMRASLSFEALIPLRSSLFFLLLLSFDDFRRHVSLRRSLISSLGWMARHRARLEVKQGFVKKGFIKRDFVQKDFIERDLMKESFTKRVLWRRGFNKGLCERTLR